jgi:hypothetical protein
MSAGWGGIVNLAGIPYDCLFIEDISAEQDLKNMIVIISQCSYLTDSIFNQFLEIAKKYLDEKFDIMDRVHFDEMQNRDHSELDKLLKY